MAVMTQPISARCAPDELPRWTVARMKLFIETLRRTQSVSAAACSVGMSRQSAYALRRKLSGHPFDKAWGAALREQELFRRMTAGYAALQVATEGDGR
jgi:hypothetical protein